MKVELRITAFFSSIHTYELEEETIGNVFGPFRTQLVVQNDKHQTMVPNVMG